MAATDRHGRSKWLGVALGLAAAMIAAHSSVAEDHRGEVAALFAKVGGANDVVLVVDGSWSMRDLFSGQIRPALPGLISELGDGDHFSMLRFANLAAEALPDRTLDPDTRAALQRETRALAEPMPSDTRTDLGAAIERAIGELTRPGFSPTQIVIFVSDFCHEPPSGSRYSDRPIPGDPKRCFFLPSEELAQTAQRVLLGHRVRVIALALEDTNPQGFEAFRRVFPAAYRVDVTGAGLGNYFERLRRELAFERLAALVADELGHAHPTAELEIPQQEVGGGTIMPIGVRVRNPMPHLPLRAAIGAVSQADPGAGFEIKMPAEPVTVPPGSDARIVGSLLVHTRPTAWRVRRAVELASGVRIEVVGSAEPEIGIAQLNLDPRVSISPITQKVVARVWEGWSVTVVLAVIVGLLAALTFAAVGVLGWFRRQRPAALDGVLTAFLTVGTVKVDLSRKLAATVGSAPGCELEIPSAAPQHLKLFARRVGFAGGKVDARIGVQQTCSIGGVVASAGSEWAGGRGTRMVVAGITVRWD